MRRCAANSGVDPELPGPRHDFRVGAGGAEQGDAGGRRAVSGFEVATLFGPQASAIAFSIADSAAPALAPSGPPAWAMSGRPPPPLPPSTTEATRARSTAL